MKSYIENELRTKFQKKYNKESNRGPIYRQATAVPEANWPFGGRAAKH